MLLEMRGDGTQTMFPPSVHPSGERVEWAAEGEPASITQLSLEQFARRLASASLIARHYPPHGNRHKFILALAGVLSKAGWEDDEVSEFILPIARTAGDEKLGDRKIEISTSAKRVADGKTVTGVRVLKDILGPKIWSKLAEWLELRSVRRQRGDSSQKMPSLIELVCADAQLIHDADEPYAVVQIGERESTLRLRSHEFDRWAANLFYRKTGKGIRQDSIATARLTLEQIALEGPDQRVYLRVAELPEGKIFLDLGDEEGTAVEITPDGWRVGPVENMPIRFRRTPTMSSMPRPEPGGNINDLRPFISCGPEQFKLAIACLVGAFHQQHPQPILVLNGEQGTGKSTMVMVLRSLIDPAGVALRALPRDPRDLAIAADQNYVLSFDNLSGMRAETSDALCILSTGGTFAVRRLYSDREQETFKALRPLILAGIAELATREDFIDRSVLLELFKIAEDSLRDESEFYASFRAAQPKILGALLDGVACALRNVKTVSISQKPRMLDFARWAAASMPAFGWTGDEFITAYMANRRAARDLSVEASPIGPLIVELAFKELLNAPPGTPPGWSGSAGELLTLLNILVDEPTRRRRDWPSTPVRLSTALRRITPALRDVGVAVERDRNHEGRRITLTTVKGAKRPKDRPQPPRDF